MAHLAIQGHATRGNEVIELLKMMGGNNYHSYTGTNEDYYIIDNGRICKVPHCVCVINQWTMYYLDDFLKKYPYKVGDKVKNVYGAYGKVYAMKWIDDKIQYRLDFGHHISGWYNADELMLPDEEKETMEEKKINQMSLANCDLDEVEIVLGDKFDLKIKDGKYYAVRKKPQYPTDYIDGCSVLGVSVTSQCEMDVAVFGDELYALYQLLVCRNAYWKIIGMEMGLGKSWEPDWNNISDKHCIYIVGGEIWLKECQTRQCTLAFPTAEMRDTFYENFKDLIKQCKDLL